MPDHIVGTADVDWAAGGSGTRMYPPLWSVQRGEFGKAPAVLKLRLGTPPLCVVEAVIGIGTEKGTGHGDGEADHLNRMRKNPLPGSVSI